jgi:hypothetical protein
MCATPSDRTNGHRNYLTERVDDGTRTRDRLDHNQELYQLSYVHRDGLKVSGPGGAASL